MGGNGVGLVDGVRVLSNSPPKGLCSTSCWRRAELVVAVVVVVAVVLTVFGKQERRRRLNICSGHSSVGGAMVKTI